MKNKICTKTMNFEECEMAILRNAIDNIEIHKKREKSSEFIENMADVIQIVEDFIRKKKAICYGGTAINNILPKEAQFYNKAYDIPDYDFYTPNALEHAKELADIIHKAGYVYVEAKAGVHHGTYKVFVNFIPIADIIDDIIDALDQDQAEIVAAKAGMVNKAQLEGENLKCHLCDLAGVSYQCDIDRIINALIDRL